MSLGTGMMKGLLVTVVTLKGVLLSLVCPNTMGRSRRRKVGRVIILKSRKKFDQKSDMYNSLAQSHGEE